MRAVHNVIIVWFLLCVTGGVLFGATLRFAWDPHEQADLIDYFSLYMGRSPGVYQGAIVDQEGGESTSTAVEVDIPPGECRYFALTAVGHEGAESGYSNEVSVCAEPESSVEPDPEPAPVPEPKPEPEPEPEPPPPPVVDPEPEPSPDPNPGVEPKPTPKRKDKHKKRNPFNHSSCFINSCIS